jgi:hypothetical protein
MKRAGNRIGLMVLGILVLSGLVLAGPSFEERHISEVGWSAVYTGSSYDAESDTTTFCYDVTVALWEKDLSHWVLAFDTDEVPVASPSSPVSYGLDPTTGVYGLKWDGGQDAGTTATYCVTLPGQVGEGEGEYSVKGGTYYAVEKITVPGGSAPPPSDTYSISGTVYVDANGDGAFGVDEPILANVSVELVDADGNVIATVLTDADGNYQFDGLVPGSYTVRVPDASLADDFNESLAEYFNGGGAQAVTIVDGDQSDVDFGYGVDTGSILDDFNADDPDGDGFSFSGTGKTIGYWKHQLAVAIKGKGRAHVDAATLQGYLDAIEALYLFDPFQFNDADEFGAAFAILKSTSSHEVDLLNKQLLGTELNEMAGRGLGGDAAALQDVLIAWCEYVSAYGSAFTRDEVLLAKDICDLINNSGG